MPRRTASGERCVGVALLAGAALLALGCGRVGYDLLPEASIDPVPNVTHGNAPGGSGGASAAGGATSASGSGSGSTSSSIDAGSTGGNGGVDAGATSGGTGSTGGTGGTGSTTADGCEPATPTASWAFAGDLQGWQLEVDPGASGDLSWTGTAGDPAPGALELDATVNDPSNARIYLEPSNGDLTGKVIYARVFLETGAGAFAKAYVQTGGSYAWADGNEVALDAQQWQCVSLDLRDPDVRTPAFDPSVVQRIGVMIYGAASPRLYVDQIAY